MNTTNENLVSELNKLVEINNDRIRGYERAIAETEDKELKSLFKDMVTHSQKYKLELSNDIKSLGAKPTEGTKKFGKIFLGWMDIQAALTGKDRKEILKSCESGEDAALEVYEEVLKSDILIAGSVRKMILDQKQEILRDHNRIKMLRDAERVL